MADYEMITFERRDNGVAWVTLNRPRVHNAFNIQMRKELKDCWRSLRYDDDLRCVVLTGAGERAFCSGTDRMETMGDGSGSRSSRR
jgi:enoyl-CoA hydratase/carnithine racemase